jgi:hypothetical protein
MYIVKVTGRSQFHSLIKNVRKVEKILKEKLHFKGEFKCNYDKSFLSTFFVNYLKNLVKNESERFGCPTIRRHNNSQQAIRRIDKNDNPPTVLIIFLINKYNFGPC